MAPPTNTTATGGYLQPTNRAYGDMLLHPVHDVIAGCTGIGESLIRPRWQREPPQRPRHDTNWVAFGVQTINQDAWAAEGDGFSARHEQIEFLCSFYGPDAMDNVARFTTTAQLSANLELAEYYGLYYGSCSQITPAPVLLNEQYYNRYDVTVEYRRRVELRYDVLTVSSTAVDLHNDVGMPKQHVVITE